MSSHYPKEIFSDADGFLFDPWHKVSEQLYQATLPTDYTCTRWKLLLEARHAWCEKRNIRYFTLVIPERHVIYEDKLPEGIKISKNRASIKLKQAFETFAPDLLLYPEAELKQARREKDVFFKTDEHLNPYGNYICYRYLLRHLEDMGLTAHAPEDYSIEIFQYTGNIGIHLEAEPSEQAEDWCLTNEQVPLKAQSVFRKGHKYLEITRQQNQALPRALFFGDSNLDHLKKFLHPHFSKLVVLPAVHQMFYDLANYERPDLIVHVMTEHQFGLKFLNGRDQLKSITLAHLDRYDFEDYFDMSLAVYEKSVVAELAFGEVENNHLYYLNGWGNLEKDRRWMLDSVSRLALDLSIVPDTCDFLYIEIKQLPFLNPPIISQQRIRLSCKVGSKVFELEDHIIHEEGLLLWKIDASILHNHCDDPMILMFEHPDAVAPFTVREDSIDQRKLSFYVTKITIYAD